MDEVIRCEFGGKPGFKHGEKGKCFTYNANEKSKRKAYFLASKAANEAEWDKDETHIPKQV